MGGVTTDNQFTSLFITNFGLNGWMPEEKDGFTEGYQKITSVY